MQERITSGKPRQVADRPRHAAPHTPASDPRTVACTRLDIPRATPHTMRHTWITEAMRAGVPDEIAAKAVGHSSTRELRTYQHARTDDVTQAMAAVQAAMRRH